MWVNLKINRPNALANHYFYFFVSDPIRKLAGQTAVYGLGTILPRFLNYLLTPFLTYAFTAAEFGINSELYAYISFLNVVFTYGMETAFFNFSTRSHDMEKVYRTAFSSLLVSTVCLALPLVLLSGTIAGALSTPNAEYLSSFITWSVLIVASDALMAIPFARLRAENRAVKFSMLRLVNIVVNFGLTIFFVYVCRNSYERGDNSFLAFLYRPEVGIGYAFLANLIANLVTLLLLIPQIRLVKGGVDRELLAGMLKYAWPLLILGLAGMVNETLDRIILKKLIADKAEAQVAQGIYGACYKVAILMTIFIQAFRFAAEPFFFGKSKEKDSKQSYALVMKYFVIFCLFLFLATVFNLDWIKYFVGEEFRVGLKVVPILLIANLCLGVVYNLSIWYKLSGHTMYGAVIAVAGAVITIVVNVVFVPEYSYMACAWATLSAYGGMMLLSYVLGQIHFPISYNLRAISFYSAVAIGLYFLSTAYSDWSNTAGRLIVNNTLALGFVLFIYRMEIHTLKKVRANAAAQGENS
jgi:O-antigen/teichoic acid export membrane protein